MSAKRGSSSDLYKSNAPFWCFASETVNHCQRNFVFAGGASTAKSQHHKRRSLSVSFLTRQPRFGFVHSCRRVTRCFRAVNANRPAKPRPISALVAGSGTLLLGSPVITWAQ